MTPEDKYFFLYLLTNQNTTQIGIYKITKKQMAFDLGYSIETVESLMIRMEQFLKIIRYNPKTRELAIKNWGKYNLQKGGKPVIDCIYSELKEVEDTSLITYVAEIISRKDILSIYESYCEMEKPFYESFDDTLTNRTTIGAQKQKEKENKKQLQEALTEYVPEEEREAVKEIITFWDENGFGISNVNAKEQLLGWLDDSSFINPKDVIIKAMQIACSNNKRRLNYVVGILKNWENESLLTVEEIELDQESKKMNTHQKVSTEKKLAGRDIPKNFELNITDGEDW